MHPTIRSALVLLAGVVMAVLVVMLADALVSHAVRANIRMSVDHLRNGSEVLEQLIARDGLLVVGAEYSLETGLVDFFDGVPED